MTAAAQNRPATSYTVELDPEVAGVLVRAAQARQTTVEDLIAAAAVRLVEDDEARLFDLTPEQAAECYVGIAAIERGEGIPHEQAVAETKARFGW